MDFTTIETFLKVAATQNISKTALQTGYSQSAITIQIQKLEKELGVKLFERIGKHVYLTEKGSSFVPYANEILKSVNAALAFSQQEEKIQGVLRIGGVESICTGLLPNLLLDFYRICPNVEIIVRSGTTTQLINQLTSNELDLVLTFDEKIYRSELVCDVLQEEKVIFLTLSHPTFDNNKIIPIAPLCEKPFILTEANAAYRYILERMLAEKGLEIHPILEVGNTETIINLLKKGMGISFLPFFTVKSLLEDGTLMELHTDLPKTTMYHQLLRHKKKWITPQMEVFTQLLSSYFQKNTIST